MITPFEHLQVGAAGQGGFDADADLARLKGRRGKVFDLDSFFAVEDGGLHAWSVRTGPNPGKKVWNTRVGDWRAIAMAGTISA